MTLFSTSAPRPTASPWSVRWNALLRGRVLARLGGLRGGAIAFAEGAARRTVVGDANGVLGTVTVDVASPRFWSALVGGGALGAGESFVAGDWHTDDPARLVRILLRDRAVLDGVDGGLSRFAAPLLRLGHALRRNTRSGSRRNIAAHYDLGDDFFAAFLDPTMTYSSAVFATGDSSLEDAQRHKLRRLCRKVGLGPGDRALEIGSGWGSMSLCAAGEFGAALTTTTISARQLSATRQRVAAAGLGDRVEVLGSDYRDLRGSYDKVLSVEMIEAVGHHYLGAFLGRCAALLRDGGLLGLQAITIADRHYGPALRRVDFIKRHVFPGSFIPSVTAIATAATRHSDLRLLHLEEFGRHYAETLRRWRLALREHASALVGRGYPPELLRTWEWYLAYCEGGFAERYLGVVQMVLGRPGAVCSPVLPAVAADPYRGDPSDPSAALAVRTRP